MSCLVSVKSQVPEHHELLINVTSQEGNVHRRMKITRTEDYKEITKEITNIGQQLSYSEVTPDIW